MVVYVIVGVTPAVAVGIVGDGAYPAIGRCCLHLLHLLVGDGCLVAYPKALKLRKSVERREIIEVRAAAYIQMTQSLGVCKRAQVAYGRGAHFQILKLGAIGQRRDIIHMVHGNDQNLKVGHAVYKVNIRHVVIMPQIQILDLGAVPELGCLIIVQHAAYSGLGGKNPLHIGAHGVKLTKPDAPDNLNFWELLPYLGHLVIGNAARVHVQSLAVFHAVKRGAHRLALVVHRHMAEIYALRSQIIGLAVKLEAVAEVCLGSGIHQLFHVLPAQLGAALVAQIDGLQVLHQSQNKACLLCFVVGKAAEIQALIIQGNIAAHKLHTELKGDLRELVHQILHLLRAQAVRRALCAAHIHPLQIWQNGETGLVLGKVCAVYSRQAQLTGCAVRHGPVRQRHTVNHGDLRIGLCPCENFVQILTAAEIRRAQIGEFCKNFRLPRLQLDCNLTAGSFQNLIFKADCFCKLLHQGRYRSLPEQRG